MEEVILVTEKDQAIGSMEKMEAHRSGRLHRAFSIFLLNDENEILLQRRSISKYHSGGLWTNTCCSHPRPEEDTKAAAHRRLQEEMGMEAELDAVFSFIYRAELDNELTEHELDHVFIGRAISEPVLNREEVEEWKYMSMAEIEIDLKNNPQNYTEWFKIVFDQFRREAEGRMNYEHNRKAV